MSPGTFADRSGQPIADPLSLAGKRIVVTGASQGIGTAMAQRLAEQGASLMLSARSADKLTALAKELGTEVRRVEVLAADLSNPDEIARLAEAAVERLGGLDVWISNAGSLAAADLFSIDEAGWDAVYDINVKAAFFGAQAAARHMRENGGGVILNTASSLAFHSVPGQPHYVSSKLAVRGLTAALAADLGRYGIRVLAIAPGLTRSEGIADLEADLNTSQGAGALDRMAEAYPARRLGEVDDIARAAAFLVSDAAAWVTGSTMLIDGGEVYGMPAAR